MITLTNLDCRYIEITSDTVSDFITNIPSIPPAYTNVKITGKLNCCDEVSEAEITSENISTSQWTLDFPTTPTLNIDELIFENYISGERFSILPSTTNPISDYLCSTGTVTSLFPIIQTWFTNNFATTVTQGYTYDGANNTCQYTIEDLPTSIRPVKIVVSRDGVTDDVFFNYVPVSNIFVSGSAFVIPPSFFGFNNESNLPDGIYEFEITFTTDTGDLIIESTCFFLDCNIKCEVSKRLKELLNCNKSGTNIFLMHYTLTEGSNCGCNCTELCEIYKRLCTSLGDDETCTNCGC